MELIGIKSLSIQTSSIDFLKEIKVLIDKFQKINKVIFS